MSVESDLVAGLLSHAPLLALVGARFAPDKVVQGAPRPYIVYVVERTPEHLLDGSVATTLYRVSLQCWADTRAGAEAVADALEGALRVCTLESPTGGLPTETREVIVEHQLDLEGSLIVTEFWIDTP